MNKIKPDDIILKYKEIYPEVEKLIVDGFYQKGMETILGEYDSFDVSGEKKAIMLTQYITSSVTALTSASQQISLQLLSLAYTMPEELNYKHIQADSLAQSLVHNILIKMHDSLNQMVGSLGAGGIAAPYQMMKAAFGTFITTLQYIKDSDGKRVFSDEFINRIQLPKSKDNTDWTDLIITKDNNVNK